MSTNCDQNCDGCNSKGDCDKKPNSLIESTNSYSNVKKVIAVVSGKGGVGKSLVTSLMAVQAKRKGNEVAILDGDITGPSIPRAFGIKEKAYGVEQGIVPVKSQNGIPIMSVNLLLENDTDPVVWRGPVISSTVKQFWTDVIWGEIDYMFVDMPPGTGDVPLTVFQSFPIDGIIVVTSPQELVSMIVGKAVKMAEMMNVPVLGIVENMSYFKCDECGKEHNIFGKSKIEETAKQFGISKIAKIPIDPVVSKLCDEGQIEEIQADWIKQLDQFM